MLTIHSGINSNVRFNTTFGERNRAGYTLDDEQLQNEVQLSEIDRIKQEYEEERSSWIEQKREVEEMLKDKDSQIPKPVKSFIKFGAVFAAGVLGGMATDYSAKYIMNTFQKMYKSNTIQKVVKSFGKNILTPTKKGLGVVTTFVSEQLAKVKKSKTYTKNMSKVEKKFDNFKNTSFVKTIKKYSDKITGNKVVKSVTGFVDKIFSKFADGVVAISDKLRKVNYKDAIAGTLGVAGGISTGAVTLMETREKDAKTKEVEENLFNDESLNGME